MKPRMSERNKPRMADSSTSKLPGSDRTPQGVWRYLAFVAIGIGVFLLLTFVFELVRANRVSAGVTAVGVDLGGLNREQAEAKLRHDLEQPLLEPVRATYGGKSTKLTA